MRNSLVPLGELEAMVSCLRDAERIAGALDDRRRMGLVWVYLSQYHWVTTHLAESRAFGERAKAMGDVLGDTTLQVVGNYYTGAACNAATAHRESVAFLRNALDALDGDVRRERFGLAGYPAVMARWLLACSLAELGEFDDAMTQAHEGLRLGEELRHPYSLILACWGIALPSILKGELAHANAHLERAIALCRDWNVPILSPVTGGFLGYVHVLSGRVAEGLASLEQQIKEHEASGLTLYHSQLALWLGEALMRADRLDAAAAQLERGIALSRERGERGLEAWALAILGDVASRGRSFELDRAEAQYRKAIALAEEIGLQPLIARCHEGIGSLYRRGGTRDAARDQLATAAAMYRRMNARARLDQVESEARTLR
jgi:tetratricopeptide (TPR) repeat protein